MTCINLSFTISDYMRFYPRRAMTPESMAPRDGSNDFSGIGDSCCRQFPTGRAWKREMRLRGGGDCAASAALSMMGDVYEVARQEANK
jgi:hypothetical protein